MLRKFLNNQSFDLGFHFIELVCSRFQMSFVIFPPIESFITKLAMMYFLGLGWQADPHGRRMPFGFQVYFPVSQILCWLKPMTNLALVGISHLGHVCFRQLVLF